jgi:hypothetical protein
LFADVGITLIDGGFLSLLSIILNCDESRQEILNPPMLIILGQKSACAAGPIEPEKPEK